MAGSGDAYLIGGATYPEDMGEDTTIYKNIEKEPLVHKIKDLEAKLPGNLAKEKEITEAQKGILEQLLDLFKELLNAKYGPLGYLVTTASEDIVHLYGVDTDEDFCYLHGGSAIKVNNKRNDRAVMGGGGRKWMWNRTLMISDPEENQINMRMTDEAISEIIAAIEKRLQAG